MSKWETPEECQYDYHALQLWSVRKTKENEQMYIKIYNVSAMKNIGWNETLAQNSPFLYLIFFHFIHSL